jgi:hypothetical protein
MDRSRRQSIGLSEQVVNDVFEIYIARIID